MTNIKISLPGGGICSILTIIFVIAKIMGMLTWSWWLVFAPLWLPVSIVMTVVIIIPAITFLFAFIWVCITEWFDKRRRTKNARRWH
jgi:uncharacterized protein (DUF2062 family)